MAYHKRGSAGRQAPRSERGGGQAARALSPRQKLDVLRAALALLPVMTREIYLLSARDDLSQDEVGVRLGLDRVEVSRELAAALVAIDEVVHSEASDTATLRPRRR